VETAFAEAQGDPNKAMEILERNKLKDKHPATEPPAQEILNNVTPSKNSPIFLESIFLDCGFLAIPTLIILVLRRFLWS
jgi:hypothetical protein